MRHVLTTLTALALLTSCTMDGFLFNSKPLDTYTLADSVIPTSRREAFQLAFVHGPPEGAIRDFEHVFNLFAGVKLEFHINPSP